MQLLSFDAVFTSQMGIRRRNQPQRLIAESTEERFRKPGDVSSPQKCVSTGYRRLTIGVKTGS
jgi:hypothetical protein